jgi:predicted RNase H-like nuclease
MDELAMVQTKRVTWDEEILALIEREGDCLVGIDASLTVPNRSGMRCTEKLVRQMGINILPTSKYYLSEKFGGSRGERMVHSLCLHGFRMAKPLDRSGRLIYEVYPHASVRAILGRHHYKHGRLEDRRRGCVELFRAIKVQNPEVLLPEGFEASIVNSDSSGIKGIADMLDSMLCSISLYRHAIYRGQTTQMIGDEDNGFILVCR